MATPTSLVRGDLAISIEEFNLEAQDAGFVGMKVFPPFDVAENAGQFARNPLAELSKTQDDTRAPGAGYKRQTMQFTMDNYLCLEHGVEESVDDRESRMYARYFDAETLAARRARYRILVNYEQRIQAQVQDTAVNFSGKQTALANKWSDPINATPIDDIDTARLQIRGNAGFLPNKLVLTYNAFLNVRKCNQVVDRIKFSGNDDPKDVTAKMLADIFLLDELIIAGAVYNTANEADAASMVSIYTDSIATLCYISNSPDLRAITLGRTIHWAEDGSSMGGSVETYREESKRSNVVRVRMDTHEKLIYSAAGWLLTNVL